MRINQNLPTLLLTLLVLGGCASNNFTECISPPYKNLGYVEVQHVLDKNKEILFDGLSEGCEAGNLVKLSNNEHYKCKENISPQSSSRAVLLNQEIRDVHNFKKDLEEAKCGSGSLAQLCRNQLKYSRTINVLENSGFEGPFIVEMATIRSSTTILVTSDDERHSIEKQLDLIPSEDYLVTKNRAWSCEYIDNNGKEFNFSDMI